MYFKGLQLQGFKSFAEKTTVDLNGGITAVVGPNGSGKSNISDAILWVMGEMSAKSLRGSKMEDVIFGGTENRKPLGFAEVTIILDNEDGVFNCDFPEISVTRRLYRSGESEYMINKAPCRLRDIHELFMDTGLGRDGYSIIGQGKIDAILSAKSEERRKIFDEAAGITKYRYRKVEAEKKLTAAQDNLTRANDIIGELEGRLGPLKKQSETAQKYLLLRDETKKLEINIWLNDIDKSKADISEIETAQANLKEQISGLEDKINETEKEITKIKDDLRYIDSDMDKKRSEMYRKRDEITRVRGEIDVFAANIKNNSDNALRLDGEIAAANSEKTFILQETEKCTAEKEILIEKLKDAEMKLGAAQSKKAEVSNQLTQLQKQLSGADSELESAGKRLAEIDVNLASNGQFIKQLEIQMTQTENDIAEQNARLEDLENSENLAAKELESLKKEVAEKEKETEKHINLAKKTEKTTKDLEDTLNAVAGEIKSMTNRKKILEDLENSFEGYSGGVKGVMNEHKFGSLKNATIYGPVSSLITVEKEYVTAIEAAAGAGMSNIVTETEDDAKRAIEYLKTSKKGRVTFMPLSSVSGDVLKKSELSSFKGYIGIASTLVNCDKKYISVVERLLGRTVVVDNIDNAIGMARKFGYTFKIATLQGEILNPGGSMTGGSMSHSGGSLSRKAEIESLAEKIETGKKKSQEAESKLLQMKKDVEKENEVCENMQLALWELKRSLSGKEISHQHIETAKAEILAVIEKYKRQMQFIVDKKNLAENERETLNRQHSELTGVSQQIHGNYEEISNSLKILGEKSAVCEQNILMLTVEKNNVQKDVEVNEGRMREIQLRTQNSDSAEQIKRLEKERLLGENEKYEKQIAESKAAIEQGEIDVQNLNDTLAAIAEKRENHEKMRDEKQENLKEYNTAAFNLRGEEGRLEAKRVKLDSDAENYITKLWEEYELTYTAAAPFREENADFVQMRKDLAELKTKIRALGNININAIEEYKAAGERYEFLTTQRDDILEAKKSLEELIGEMEKSMTDLFETNFARLKTSFGETFRELFGGGSATIELSNPEDILESGVEINVQPPGKKLQSITLLSGGEKAFTAIALIFSILKINPTLFCVFDEIEAALDDVNVFRFADYLRRLAKKTQFIVITHRKGTMEAADTLYGVTMREKGVTSLLSLDLNTVG